jgi:hypothetical protein
VGLANERAEGEGNQVVLGANLVNMDRKQNGPEGCSQLLGCVDQPPMFVPLAMLVPGRRPAVQRTARFVAPGGDSLKRYAV